MKNLIENRQWYDNSFVALEAALEILSTANGFRSAWIFMESKKEAPNHKKINQWEKEQEDFLKKVQEVRSGDKNVSRYVLDVLAKQNCENFKKINGKCDKLESPKRSRRTRKNLTSYYKDTKVL